MYIPVFVKACLPLYTHVVVFSLTLLLKLSHINRFKYSKHVCRSKKKGKETSHFE